MLTKLAKSLQQTMSTLHALNFTYYSTGLRRTTWCLTGTSLKKLLWHSPAIVRERSTYCCARLALSKWHHWKCSMSLSQTSSAWANMVKMSSQQSLHVIRALICDCIITRLCSYLHIRRSCQTALCIRCLVSFTVAGARHRIEAVIRRGYKATQEEINCM